MSISGEKSLQKLIRSMEPTLVDGTWAFVSVPRARPMPVGVTPLMMFEEPEGWTLIMSEREAATTGYPTAFISRCIRINVHSSLYAVGFLAAITARLAKFSISVNVISAYFHDYIFVPADRAEEATKELKKLATE